MSVTYLINLYWKLSDSSYVFVGEEESGGETEETSQGKIENSVMEWENGGGFRGETGCQVFLSISTCRLQTRENWNGLLRGCPKRSIPPESPGDFGK